MKKAVPGDYVLTGLIVAASIASLRLVGPVAADDRAVAVIRSDGRVVAMAPLNRDKVLAPAAPGLDMDVEVKAGKIRVLRTGCPNKLCMEEGAISRPGETITCVPNRVLITVEGDASPDYEAIAY